MPGVGTNWYGGVYYEGNHRYNIETFLQEHPDARSVDEKGSLRMNSICPLHPRFTDWLREGVQWLFREFAIGGANLENAISWFAIAPAARGKLTSGPPPSQLLAMSAAGLRACRSGRLKGNSTRSWSPGQPTRVLCPAIPHRVSGPRPSWNAAGRSWRAVFPSRPCANGP